MKNSFIFIFVLVLTSCGGAKKISTEKPDPKPAANLFLVSQGGGITGQYETYLVKKDGQVFSIHELTADTTVFSKLNKTVLATAQEKMALINMSQTPKGGPGNMNYHLVIYRNNSDFVAHWADAYTPKKNILDFYAYVFSEIKKSKK